MRNLTKWALGSLLVCSGVLAASQTTTVSQSVNRSVSEWVSSKAAMQATLHSEALTELEKSVSTTQFDSANRMHALRLKRIMFYILQARAYE